MTEELDCNMLHAHHRDGFRKQSRSWNIAS